MSFAQEGLEEGSQTKRQIVFPTEPKKCGVRVSTNCEVLTGFLWMWSAKTFRGTFVNTKQLEKTKCLLKIIEEKLNNLYFLHINAFYSC